MKAIIDSIDVNYTLATPVMFMWLERVNVYGKIYY